MKICAISDIHNQLSKLKLPDADLLIIAGDMTNHGSVPELTKFNYELGMVKDRYRHGVVAIAGNHDSTFEFDPALARSLMPNITWYLEDTFIEIDGLKIWGTPWTPVFGMWNFMADFDFLDEKFRCIPKDTDILVSHGPPYGVLDMAPRGVRAGCNELASAVFKTQPEVHIFGHIHNGYGQMEGHGTRFYNVSVCNERYLPLNPPTIIEI